MLRRPPVARRLGAGIVLLTVLYVAYLLLRPGDPSQIRGIDALITAAYELFSLALCGLAFKAARGRVRPTSMWLAILVGLSTLCALVADSLQVAVRVPSVQAYPSPSWATACSLASYPLLLAALLLLTSRPLPVVTRAHIFFDGLMIGVAALTFSWYYILGPTLLQTTAALPEKILEATYLLFDLVVLFYVVLLWARVGDRSLPRHLAALAAGVGCIVLADSIHAYQLVHGTYTAGTLLDAGRPIGFLLLGLSAYLQRQAGPPAQKSAGQVPPVRPPKALWRSLIPYVFVPAVGVLLLSTIHSSAHPGLKLGVYLGTGALMGLVLLSQVIALLESKEYSRSLERLNADLRTLNTNNDALAAANRQLEIVAKTDTLTGLPNRTLLYDRLTRALEIARRGDNHTALLLMDLDRFKEVNDTLGHYFGDRLLQQIGTRLRNVLKATDTAARLGGDEFAVLLPITDAARAVEVARCLLHALEKPFVVDGQTLEVGASVGIALSPNHGSDASTLMRCADVAMYIAKRAQSGHALYAQDADPHSPRRLALLTELRRAIAQDGLILQYQPKVHLATCRVTGVEALVRWVHPEHGLIAPDQFIPLAEQTGLIVPLTQWVVETAIRQCQSWHAEGLPLEIAVNLSTRVLHNPRLTESIAELLTRYQVAPATLTLEITESMLMADPTHALEVLTRLDKIGVRISIDDFGTGYSSLSYLKRLPVDEIKLDKAFVESLSAHRNTGALKDRLIVRSVTALAHALGMEVVAEGVETHEAWELLGHLRCNTAQGYYLSRPLPAAELAEWARHSAWALDQPTDGVIVPFPPSRGRVDLRSR